MKSFNSYIFQSERHSLHTHTHMRDQIYIQHRYSTKENERERERKIKRRKRRRKKHRRQRDGMMPDYLVNACFVLLLDEELPWDKVGEFDRLPADAWTNVFDDDDDRWCDSGVFECWWKFSFRFNSDCQTAWGQPVRPLIFRGDNVWSN